VCIAAPEAMLIFGTRSHPVPRPIVYGKFTYASSGQKLK
jgi:hypothetical protein